MPRQTGQAGAGAPVSRTDIDVDTSQWDKFFESYNDKEFVDEVLRPAAEELKIRAKRTVPVDTGALKAGIQARVVNQFQMMVFTTGGVGGRQYGFYAHEGIPARTGYRWRRGSSRTGKMIYEPEDTISPMPWSDAPKYQSKFFERHLDDIMKMMEDLVKEMILDAVKDGQRA